MKTDIGADNILILIPETQDEAVRLLAGLVADICELNWRRRDDPGHWKRLDREATAIKNAIRRGFPSLKWRVIAVDDGWCLFDGNGQPNSNHPRTTDRELAERIAKLLNTEP
jgi:hypothetical protein